MILFNLPQTALKVKKQAQRTQVWDELRKRWVALTPEEWVRQLLIHFLVNQMGYPKALIAIEQQIMVNGLTRRCDVIVYSRQMLPLLIIECKAPDVKVQQTTFDQVAAYNVGLPVSWLLATNGNEWLCCKIQKPQQSIEFLNFIPRYDQLADE